MDKNRVPIVIIDEKQTKHFPSITEASRNIGCSRELLINALKTDSGLCYFESRKQVFYVDFALSPKPTTDGD